MMSYRKKVVNDGDVGVLRRLLYECAFHLESGVVLVVKDAEVAVPALFVKVKRAVGPAVEVDAVFHEILDSRGGFLDYNLDDVFLR